MMSPLPLPDGAIVRSARADDLPAARALEADREGEDDAVDLELVANTPGARDGMAVVERDGEIVSIATLLAERVRVGQTTLSVGQVEMVATASDAEGRGYARALMNWCHDLSASRGDAMQVMIGIPNFYRQFGYHYSIPMHPWATVPQLLTPPAGFSIRRATVDDANVTHSLQDATQSSFDIAMPHSEDCWRWILNHPSSVQVLAVGPDGVAAAVARMVDDHEGSVEVGELAASTTDATRALLAHAWSLAGTQGGVRVNVRQHVPGLADLVTAYEPPDWYYVRIADPVTLLSSLAPELLRRLHGMGHESGEALLSFYRAHVRLTWDAERLTVTGGGPFQAPVSAGGSGLPLDALAALLFSGGAAAVEEHFADAYLGRQDALMRALFPPQSADLLTFYLPS